MSLDRRTLLKVSALGVGGLAASTAAPASLLPAAHAGPPPTPSFGPGIEGYARYQGQTQCIGSEQPGVAAFKQMVLAAYPGTRNLGVIRACGIGGSSEHKEGRAWDWGVYVNRANEAAAAQEVINWLLATDRHGNRHANARRLGLMYMIWNRRIWKAYSNPGTWHNYTGASPHTDHIHFSFGWPGAKKQTSFFGATSQAETGSWSGWTPTAAGIASAPSATSWSPGRTDVFAVSPSGTLIHRWFMRGVGWAPGSSWEDLGAPRGRRLTSAPAVVSRGEGMLDVFVRGSDNRMYVRSYSLQTRWQPWGNLGGTCTSEPAAVANGAHILLVVRGSDGALWSRTWERGWRGWSKLTGKVTSGPALVSWAPGHYDLFARGSGRDLVHKVYDSGKGWSGWMSRGGLLQEGTTISAVSMYPGRLDVFCLGTNENMYRKVYQGGRWSPGTTDWGRFGAAGGGFVEGIGTTSLDSKHVEIFTRGEDGRLYQRWWN